MKDSEKADNDIEIDKRGRPRIALNYEKFDVVCRFNGSKRDAAEICGVSEDTIERRLKEDHGMNFSEYRQKKMAFMRMKLAQKQFETAMNGNVAMLIWLGKNHLGQSDKMDIESNNYNEDSNTLKIEFVDPDETS